MHFHQHIQMQLSGQLGQLAQPGILQCGDDQQNGISTDQPRFMDLIGIDDEILAQCGQGAGGARLTQVILMTLEKVMIGQYR